MLDQSNVATATTTITATRAAIGMAATTGPATRIIRSRNTPADSVDNRVRPPLRRLIIDWPIIAQPAMPPRKPVMTFAMPCPRASRSLSEFSSVMSSISCAVSRDSSRPTMASVKDTGAMIAERSRTRTARSAATAPAGIAGSSPMSPTVGTTQAEHCGRATDGDDGDQW